MKKKLPSNVIAWVDVDSILNDFYEVFHAHLNERYAVTLPEGFIPSDWSYSDCLSNLSFAEAFDSLPESWPASLKVYRGAENFMAELHQMGCYVVLLTHLPEKQKHYRIENLIKNNIYFDEIYFPFGQPKSEVAQRLLGRYESGNGKPIEGFIVDDYFKNIIDISKLEHVKAAFSLDYPFNEPFKANLPQDGTVLRLESKNPDELYREVIQTVRTQFFAK